MLKIISVILCLFSTLSFADSLEGFNKRFKIIKNEQGAVTYVKMNFVSQSFNVIPYIKLTIEDIKSEIQRMQQKSYQGELDGFIEEISSADFKSAEQEENVYAVAESIKGLKAVDIDAMVAKVYSSGILKKFQAEIKDALNKYSLSTIASTEDSRYFYKRNVTYEVVRRVLDFAKKKFDSIPLLNLASTIIVRVHDLVLEQRLFYQNMFLHYLENFEESQLGMTKEDADLIFSSIYESRISAINYFESRDAAANWTRYGLNKFYSMVRGANTRIRRASTDFESVGNRYNYAFVDVMENGEKLVKNLVNNQHMFSSKMSTAYNYNKPNKVRRFRSLLNIAEVGLGFLPIPGWLKSQVEGFISSFYVEQKRSEGALVGYFESHGDQEMMSNITKQMINPYILF